MKKNLVIILLGLICIMNSFGDAADPGVIVMRTIKFENLSDFEDRFDFYIMQQRGNGSDYVFFRLHGNVRLEAEWDFWDDFESSGGNFDTHAQSFIVAVPKNLDHIDPESLITTGRIEPISIYGPMQRWSYDWDYYLLEEELTYTITGFTGNRVFMDIRVKYNDLNGEPDKETSFFARQTPREFRSYVKAEEFRASSILEEGTFNPGLYHPYHVFDGLPDTGWSEGVSGPGIGQSFGFTLERNIMVDRIVVSPGWFVSALHKRNNRVKTLEMHLGGTTVIGEFTDAMTEQEIVLDEPVRFQEATFIIKEIYPTTDWNDTPISDIRFFNGDREIRIEGDLTQIPISELPVSDY